MPSAASWSARAVADSDKIRLRAERWIKEQSKGTIFHLSTLYRELHAKFASECDARGIMDN